MLKSLQHHFFRIDARSLGLFRISFALVLIGDLFGRWRWLRDFYSNEGVLPNHNHLFNLRDKQEVFSVYHAFSTPAEAHFAFFVTLCIYLCFLIGFHTRLFHVLSLVFLVSLTSRNILLENAGNYAAIAILMVTAFLPCGSRFSLDSLRQSLDLSEEKSASDLNNRTPWSEDAVTAGRWPGWSPVSLAAFALLLQLALIYLCSALQQNGEAFHDGTALYTALHVDRWASDLGGRLRHVLPASLLTIWTRAFHGAQFAIPVLLVVPVLFRWTRGLAALLMLFHGLTLALLFDFGLFGWSLLAATPLVISPDSWNAYQRRSTKEFAKTVIYDADCGFCFWIARLLKRADLKQRLTFQGNDNLTDLWVAAKDGDIELVPLPQNITPELANSTVIVVDSNHRIFTRGQAVTEVLRSLPLGSLALPLTLPGFSNALNAIYNFIAVRRMRISVLMGKEACGVDLPEADIDDNEPKETSEGTYRQAPLITSLADQPQKAAPAVRLVRFFTGSFREIAVAIVAIAMLAQTAKENPLPAKLAIPQGKFLAAVASWPRMLAKWDLLAPSPPHENGVMIIDAQTRAGEAFDLLTGEKPNFDLSTRGPVGLGQLWSDYLDRIRQKEWSDFQRAYRDYLAKGGPIRPPNVPNTQISGLDAYWVTTPIPSPGQPPSSQVNKLKIFTHARGGLGQLGVDRLPLVRPSGSVKQP